MPLVRQSNELERGAERRVEVQLGPLVGFDLRPSRLFLWYGGDRAAERIVPLGRAPRVLRGARPRRSVHLPGLEVSYLGNPLVTVALAGRAWYRELRKYAAGS